MLVWTNLDFLAFLRNPLLYPTIQKSLEDKDLLASLIIILNFNRGDSDTMRELLRFLELIFIQACTPPTHIQHKAFLQNWRGAHACSDTTTEPLPTP